MSSDRTSAKIYQWPIAPKKTRWQEFQEAVALYDPNEAELEFQKTMKEEYGDEEPPPSKGFIDILLLMESRGHEPKAGILMLYDRELCGFRLDALREVVDRMEKEYPDSPRIKEMRDKIQYRETHGLIDGGM